MDDTFTVTAKWLNAHRTARGGFCSSQICALGWERGLKQTGWFHLSVGMKITEEQRKEFERLALDGLANSTLQEYKKKHIAVLSPEQNSELKRILAQEYRAYLERCAEIKRNFCQGGLTNGKTVV